MSSIQDALSVNLLASPLDIPDCVLWIQADKITGHMDGDALSSWGDLSGSGVTLTQSDPSYRPIYHLSNGVAYVSNVYAGGLSIASLPATDTGLCTVFLVVRSGANSSSRYNHILSLGGITNFTISEDVGFFDPLSNATENFYTGHRTSTEKWTVLAVRGDRDSINALGAGVTTIANGSFNFRNQGSSDATWGGTATTSGFLGGLSAAATGYWLGDWRAGIVYSRVLSDIEVFRVLSYLHRAMSVTYTAPEQAIIFDGDSQTTGYTGGGSGETGFTEKVLGNLSNFRAYNLGVVNQTIAQANDDAATQIDPLFDADLSRDIIVIWAGTNDINDGSSAATAYDDTVAYCQNRRAAGFKVMVCTTLPRGASSTYEEKRQELNASIRDNWTSFADGIADIGGDATIGAAGAQHNSAYYQSDAIHLTPTGYDMVAGIVENALPSL